MPDPVSTRMQQNEEHRQKPLPAFIEKGLIPGLGLHRRSPEYLAEYKDKLKE